MTGGRRVIACLAAVLLLTLGPIAPAAFAESATRTAWWNSASAGGIAAPAPTTPPDGLHIAAGAGQPLAYAAVLYPLPAGSTGTLSFAIEDHQGAVGVQACPTKAVTWKAGGDQPSDAAPHYTCDAVHYQGVVNGSGTTVTFTLAAVTESTPGLLSLAIVPAPGAVSFSLDLAKPGPRSLTVFSRPPAAPSRQPSSAPAPTSPSQPDRAAAPSAGQPLGVPQSPPDLPPPASGTTNQPGTAPQVAPSSPTSPALAADGSGSSGTRATIGSILGALALLAAFLFWGLGRGLLGGRITPLSVPLPTGAAASHKR